MKPKIILIHPPISKASEPPAGLAKIAGCLKSHAVPYQIIDANLEGTLDLLNASAGVGHAHDRWTKRSGKNLEVNLTSIRRQGIYRNLSRYQRTVHDINHLLKTAGNIYDAELSLADYRQRQLTPSKSVDLLYAAEHPELNPFYPYFCVRLLPVLNEEPEFIGFSLNYLSQALCTFAMIGLLKRENPRQKIILGGSLTTSWLKITGQKNIFRGLVDEMVPGAGERKLLKLFGLSPYPTDAAPYYRDFLLNDYLSPAPVLPYSTARGCYWHQCSFCPEQAEDNPFEPEAPTQTLEHLQNLSGQLRPGLIHLLDNALSPALLQTLSRHSFDAPWYGFARVTSHLTVEDLCRSLQQSGCAMLKLGIESGDQKVLDALNKGINLSAVELALKAIKKAGIATYVYLLFGTPPEDEASAQKTLQFVIEQHDQIDFLNLAIFNLPVLSSEAQNLHTFAFYEGDLSLYRDFVHPLGWQRSAVRKFLEKTFKKHPAVAGILRRTPPFFTSNHAPFLLKAAQ